MVGGGRVERVVRRSQTTPSLALLPSFQALCAQDDTTARALRHTPAAVRSMLADFLELRDDRDGGAPGVRSAASFKRR